MYNKLMPLQSGKHILVVVVIILVILASVMFALTKANNGSAPGVRGNYGPKPESNLVDSYYANEIYYECSRTIHGQWAKGSAGQIPSPAWEFRPDSIEEAKKYCREGGIIEYKSVLDIMKMKDISEIVEKYDSYEVSVKALSHKYINDKEYLSRILPNYKSSSIDCIIVVNSPEGTRFFLENGDVHDDHDDHKYIEVPAEEFLASLNNAPDADVTAFWLALH
jgi:hypothetical protein